MITRLLIFFCFPSLLLLSSCAQLPSDENATGKPYLQTLPPDHWHIQGKLGIRSPEQNGSVSVQWQQQQQEYRIQIQGPLGQGSALLQGNDQAITIEQAGKAPLYSNAIETLLAEALGWTFPIDHLPYWIRGIPKPEHEHTIARVNADGTLEALQQAQWTIEYSRYQTVKQWQLPGKVVAARNDTRLTLIIREWQLLP